MNGGAVRCVIRELGKRQQGSPVPLPDVTVHSKHRMQSRVESFRHGITLRMIRGSFCLVVSYDLLQLIDDLVFELSSSIGVQYFRRHQKFRTPVQSAHLR